MTTKRLYLVVGVVLLLGLAVTPALAYGLLDPTTTLHVTPSEVTAMPACPAGSEYLPGPFFQNFTNPAGSGTVSQILTVLGQPVTVDLTYYADNSWDFTISGGVVHKILVKGASTLLYEFSPPATHDTGLHEGVGADGYGDVSHLEFCLEPIMYYPLTAEKTAAGTYDRTVTWTLDKSVDDDYHSGFIGQTAGSSNWTVTATKFENVGNYNVTGTITVYNSNSYPVDFTISDTLNDGSVATVTCDSYTVPANGSKTCTYEAFPTGATATLNTAVVTAWKDSYDLSTTATAPVSFVQNLIGYDSGTLSDPDFGYSELISATTSKSFPETFTCPADATLYVNGKYTFYPENWAYLNGNINLSDSATVTVDCYAPVITKDASASYDETHTWTITKSVNPEFQKGFAGDLLPWTWTVDVSETSSESNFAVTGYIYVANPAGSPGNMVVSLADQLNDGTFATVDCGSGATSVTVAPGATATCSYTAAPGGRTATLNTATGTFNAISFVATYPVAFVPNIIDGTATVTDTEIGLDVNLTAGLGPWTFSADDGHLCSSEAWIYAGDGMYDGWSSNVANLVASNGQSVSDGASTAYECYAPILLKTAYASYNEIHTWTIEKSVNPESQSGFAADVLDWTWTVTVSESTEDDNFYVEGTIYVDNPAGSPGPMTVSLADQLNDSTVATVDCGDGATSVTVAPGAQGSCSYTAIPTGKTATKNIATGTFNGIAFPAEKDFTFGVTVIDGTATVTDTEIGLNETLTAGEGSWTFTADDGHTCSTDATAYVDGDGTSYSGSEYNLATVTGSDGQTDSDDATTTYACYLWDVTKTADGTYNDRYDWTITKTVSPESQSGFAGETLRWTWSITWNSFFVEEINHAVEGVITVTNPAPIPLTVYVTDFLTGGFAAVVDCDGSGGTSLTVPANSFGTCDYTAAPDSQLAQNTATATRKGVSVSDTVNVTWVPGADVGLDAVISDSNHEDIPVDSVQPYTYTKSVTCEGADYADYGDDGKYTGYATNTAEISWTGGSDDSTANTAFDCYLPSISKDAAGTYNERHEWTVVKDVTPPTSGYPGDELGWTWTVTVTEVVVEENFNVSGQITVINPNPEDAMTVMLSDVLSDDKPAVITACTGDADLTDGLTIPKASIVDDVVVPSEAVCDYQALNLGYNDDADKAKSNIASFSLFGIDYAADATIAWEVNRIHPNVTLTDDQGPLSEPLTGHTDPGTYPFAPFSYSDSHTCSSIKADYFVGGVYTAISEKLDNLAKIKDGETLLDEDDATTTWTCEAGFIDLLKLYNGVIRSDISQSFVLYYGPDGFGSTPIGTSSTSGDADGVLEFGGPALRPDEYYTVCELEAAAGWATYWQVDLDGDGVLDAPLIPYNPEQNDDPPADNGNRCIDFGASTTIPVTVGTTIRFQIDNTYPGGNPRTPGYWKNWNRCTGGGQQFTAAANGGYAEGFWLLEDVLDPTIGGGIVWDDILSDDIVFNITSCEQAVLILDKRNVDGKKVASDPLHNLATHLLAAQLNFGAGACTDQGALDAALDAEKLLDKYNFQGEYAGKVSKADGALANSLAGTLDAYNNGMYCGDLSE